MAVRAATRTGWRVCPRTAAPLNTLKPCAGGHAMLTAAAATTTKATKAVAVKATAATKAAGGSNSVASDSARLGVSDSKQSSSST